MATVEIKGAVDIAVEWIETTLAKCKGKVLEVLESVFNAINFSWRCCSIFSYK